MKNTNASILLFFVLFAMSLLANAQNNDTKNTSVSGKIQEEKFVSINGIEQWITVKGESSKPIILFIHGGPGSPISPYSDVLYKEWEKDFIIV